MKLLKIVTRKLRPSPSAKKIAELERQIRGYQKECDQVEQVLGMALGYPWYKDDQDNFPGADEKSGVCVGEHTPVSIALEAANTLERLRELLKATKTEDLMKLATAAFNALEPEEQRRLNEEQRQNFARANARID